MNKIICQALRLELATVTDFHKPKTLIIRCCIIAGVFGWDRGRFEKTETM